MAQAKHAYPNSGTHYRRRPDDIHKVHSIGL